MEPIVELEIPDVVPDEEEGPFEVRGVMRFHEELVRAQGFRDRMLEDGRATRPALDQDVAAVREWFADRGLNLAHPVVASTAIITLSLTRGRVAPGVRHQIATAAIDAIDRLHATLSVPPSERQLRLFD